MNKLLHEYLEYIKETPIEDISHIGDSNTATNFTKPEIKMLKSEKYEKRLRNAFKNTPFVFDIVFLYHDKFDANTKLDNRGRFSDHVPITKIDKNYDENIKSKPGVITFVLQGNLSPTDRIPITPWILAHKIGHALEDDNDDLPHSINYDNFYTLSRKIQNKIRYLTSHEKENLFSFKSWAKVQGNDEFIAELIAMYLIQGQVKANTNNEEFLSIIDKINNEIFQIFKSLQGYVLTEV